jgi:NO-binding membrane sensor protein with MHYT domain
MRSDPLSSLIPIVALIVAWAIAFIALDFRKRTRELRHKERMAALEKGIELTDEPALARNAYLLRGLIWLFLGVGISCFFLALWIAEHDRDEAAMSAVGLIPFGVGIAYLIVYRVETRQRAQGSVP